MRIASAVLSARRSHPTGCAAAFASYAAWAGPAPTQHLLPDDLGELPYDARSPSTITTNSDSSLTAAQTLRTVAIHSALTRPAFVADTHGVADKIGCDAIDARNFVATDNAPTHGSSLHKRKRFTGERHSVFAERNAGEWREVRRRGCADGVLLRDDRYGFTKTFGGCHQSAGWGGRVGRLGYSLVADRIRNSGNGHPLQSASPNISYNARPGALIAVSAVVICFPMDRRPRLSICPQATKREPQRDAHARMAFAHELRLDATRASCRRNGRWTDRRLPSATDAVVHDVSTGDVSIDGSNYRVASTGCTPACRARTQCARGIGNPNRPRCDILRPRPACTL
jgi:hypothetical protein